jgi:hypothetical protein
LDEARRGLESPTVGQGRRKDKRSYPIPQAKKKYNVHHRARQRSARYEETTRKNHHCVDTKN